MMDVRCFRYLGTVVMLSCLLALPFVELGSQERVRGTVQEYLSLPSVSWSHYVGRIFATEYVVQGHETATTSTDFVDPAVSDAARRTSSDYLIDDVAQRLQPRHVEAPAASGSVAPLFLAHVPDTASSTAVPALPALNRSGFSFMRRLSTRTRRRRGTKYAKCKEGKHMLLPKQAAYCHVKCPRSANTICPLGPECDFDSSSLNTLGTDWLRLSGKLRTLELTHSKPWGNSPTFKHMVMKAPSFIKYLPRKAKLIPKMFGRCAIVGNSGVLNHLKAGTEIDTYERVIRLNLGPTHGFEDHVGKRIDVDIVNGYHFTYEMLRAKSNKVWLKRFLQNMETKIVIYFAYYTKSFRSFEKIRRRWPKLRIVMPNFPGIQKTYRERCNQMRLADWGLWDHSESETKRAERCFAGFDIGSLSIQLGIELCQSVNMFGFFPFPKNWLSGQTIDYHYWPFEKSSSKTLVAPRLNTQRGSIGFELQLAMVCISRWRCRLNPDRPQCKQWGYSSSKMGKSTAEYMDHFRSSDRAAGDIGTYHIDISF